MDKKSYELFYVDVIIYPCPKADARFAELCNKNGIW